MSIPTSSIFDKVLEKINEIAKESATSDYIYRGEPKHYNIVCSSLYREFPDLDRVNANIASIQDAILEEAKAYIGQTDNIDETDDIGLLTQLQHFGGKTNLIDFTEDYLVALFFACDGSHEEDGRIILLERESDVYAVRTPRRTINRVESQKSVFVESPDGFVTPNIAVTIPADLKFPILSYLEKYHRISIATTYNDLHGFIKRSAYREILKGLTCQREASETENREAKLALHEKAIKRYTEALKLKPDYEIAYKNRGIVYYSKGDFFSAIEDYSAAIALNPENADAYNNRGAAYADKGDFFSAIEDYSAAIALNPENADAYNNRGAAYADKGDFDAAIEDYSAAIVLKPEDAGNYTNRGNAYYNKGDFDTAIEDYSAAIALNPENADAYNNRGAAYHKEIDFAKAIEDYNRAVALNPESSNAYNNRGVAYADKGDFDAAIEDYNRAITLDPENATNAYNNRGKALLHLRHWEKAKADLMAAKEMGVDIAASFRNGYESVEDFEAKNGVEVPVDITALISGNRT